jgi:hypothetical protein
VILSSNGCGESATVATMTLSSNELGEIISARCYCDRARLVAIECSNGRGDNISLLLQWPSSTSHRKIYDMNKQSELNIT